MPAEEEEEEVEWTQESLRERPQLWGARWVESGHGAERTVPQLTQRASGVLPQSWSGLLVKRGEVLALRLVEQIPGGGRQTRRWPRGLGERYCERVPCWPVQFDLL